MTLDELLPQKLAEWRFSDDRRTLTVTAVDGGWAVDLTADCADAVGCRLWEVAMRPTTSRTGLDLKAWANRVANRATGLLEPLTVIEVDDERRIAQLRSEEPARRDGELQYYELLLEGNGWATIRRYQASRLGSPARKQRVFTLTHEALAKLVGDLATA